MSLRFTESIFFCILLVVFWQDITGRRIQDRCHTSILVLAVLEMLMDVSLGNPGTELCRSDMAGRLLGMLCGGLPFFFICLIAPGAFGGGDMKLMAVSGFFLGWRRILVSAVCGFMFGGICIGILLAGGKADRETRIPFAPFLCAGMMVSVLWGSEMIKWYVL